MSEFYNDDYFIECVKDNNIIKIKKILENDPSMVSYDNNRALMIACSYGYYDIVELLVKYGGNVNIHNGHLLTLAMMSKNYETVTLLFNNNIKISKYNFILSYSLNNIKMFRHLLKFINIDNIINMILELSIEKNNNRMIIEIIKHKKIFKNNILFIQAKKHIDNINSIYNKLLLRINKKSYNTINMNIIQFIW
jgi:ankyrin repeat protein